MSFSQNVRLCDINSKSNSTVNNQYYAHYREYDGKWQTLENHILLTSYKSRNNCKKIGMPVCGELMGLLHDLGKYNPHFQNYFLSSTGFIKSSMDGYLNPESLKGKIDHATLGAQYCWRNFNKSDIGSLVSQIIALCVYSHHGGLRDCLDVYGCNKFAERIKRKLPKYSYDEISQTIDSGLTKKIQDILNSDEIVQELRVKLYSVFIDKPVREISDFYVGFLVRLLFSTLIDADRTDTANFKNPSREKRAGVYPEWKELICEFETHIKQSFTIKNQIDEIRSYISEACLAAVSCDKGAYLLTLPTGSGKTLASLRFALNHAEKHNMDRIVYVIPYTSIIDQNAKIARDIFKKNNRRQVVLEHHSNLLPQNDTEENQIFSENWDAPIVFTTMVQFLDTLFSDGTRGVRRLHQLANSVVIFDEIQLLPIKMVHLFNNAMNFLVKGAGTTAIYCTATQPLLDKVDSVKGALQLSKTKEIVQLTDDMKKTFIRCKIFNACKPGGWSNTEISENVLENLDECGNVLVIVNTKKVAKELYKLCKYTYQSDNVFHLSTSMCPAHRKKVFTKINNLINISSPVICISTQLIEAGVDIDFNCVMRSLAGFDSIAQAAGRCNRHGKKPGQTGKVVVFDSTKENLDRLEDIKKAQNVTRRILGEIKEVNHSDEFIIDNHIMDRFYKYYFFERKEEMSYQVNRNDIGRDDNLLNLLSTNSNSFGLYKLNKKSDEEFPYLRQSFKKAGKIFEAIDAPTKGVIVPYGKAGKYIISRLCSEIMPEEYQKLLKRSQRYSVNLFPYILEKLLNSKYIFETQKGSGILYLSDECYSDEYGVTEKPECDMRFLNA